MTGIAGESPASKNYKMDVGVMMMADVEEERPILIRFSEAARMLGVSTMTIYKMIRTGKLSCYDIPGSTKKVNMRDIDSIIKATYKPHASCKD